MAYSVWDRISDGENSDILFWERTSHANTYLPFTYIIFHVIFGVGSLAIRREFSL